MRAGSQGEGLAPPAPPPEAQAPAGPAQAAAPQAPLPPPTGRPPLPRSLPPSSASSSRASSPGRGGLSAQPSLHTLNMNRVAQYRPAARTFKPDASPRRGLNTGDVVALRSQGKLLVVVELGTDPLDPGAVHYGLQPSDAASPADTRLAHLEVIRQGKWLGFRSAATGDRFLQARKRSPNRLVFFSQNVGTWEQWELGAPAAGGAPPADPDAADWTSLALTLRHRRLPQYELAVEAVRVGTYSLPPSASVTPRSLLAGSGDTASAGSVGSEEDPTLERRELKRMSGVLLHEWLHYVDQEKAARLAIEARVAQMAEDAAGLREWAAMQVEAVRSELGGEVDLLLDTVQRKSAKLADAEARLTGRLRWGVAMIQAKAELGVKRQVFMVWRWLTTRQRYCRHVESKLQQRANLRLQLRAVQAWLEVKEQAQARQEQLRNAVRCMAHLKLVHAFAAWRDLVACKREQEADAAALDEAVGQHMQRWRLRRLVRGWQQHAAGCAAGRQALQRMASQAARRAVGGAFGAWRACVAQRQQRLASLTALVATRQCQRTQQAAFQGWRLLVDDTYGARLQAQHARQVLARSRLRHVLLAWRGAAAQRADCRERWDATVAYMRQRTDAIHMDSAFAAWQGHVSYRREERALLYEAVQHMALRKMAAAFQHWRYLAAYRRHARAVLEQSVGRLTQRTLATAWAAWQQHVAETRVARHRVAVCQRRHQASLLRSALAGWREAALLAGAERQIVQLCQRRADRNRMAAALAAFKASAEAAAVKREQDSLAVAWYAERLQAKALRALAAAVEGRRLFESQLLAVAAEQQQQAVTKAFAGWRAVAALSTSEHQLVAAAQRRSARRRLHACFQAWRSHTEAQLQQQAHLQQQLELCVGRLAEMRLAWALDVWRQRTADAVAQRRLVAAGQRLVARVRLAAAFAGWQQHTCDKAAARQAAEEAGAAHDAALQAGCFSGWARHAAEMTERQAAMMSLVQRRATWMQASVLHCWRAYVGHQQRQRVQLRRAERKLASVCQRHAFAAWRVAVEERRAEHTRLAVAERRLSSRRAALAQAAAFRGWHSHTVTLAAARAAVDAKVAAEGAVVQRHVLAAWRGATDAAAERRDHLLRICVERRCTALQSKALFVWQLVAQRHAHNREALEMMVHCMARRVMHAVLLSWQQAAQERKVRRTAIARFIQRWDAQRKAAALAHWRRLLADKAAAADNLRRCLTRKRIAFRQFRQWYWESFDDDMQETLRTMFEITEEAALDPLPSRAGSPYGSLLSSPIRQQLGMSRQQQLQLSSGVAAALMQQQDEGGFLGLPAPTVREPLSSRLAAAEAAGRGGAVRAGAQQTQQLGSVFTTFSTALLEPVEEVPESPYLASAGKASSTASTAIPEYNSPLTPASGYAAGGTPLSGVSRWTTPGGGRARQSPGGLSEAATPGGGGLALLGTAERQAQLGALLDAATPAYSLGSAARGQQELLGSALRSPLGYAAAPTPQPDFGSASPYADMADAPTPGELGLGAGYEIRRFSDGTEYMAPRSPAAATLGTPLSAQKTPVPGLHLGQRGDYSIRSLGDEARKLAAEATPSPRPHSGRLIAAFHASAPRTGQPEGAEEGLSAAKTPLSFLNPLAY